MTTLGVTGHQAIAPDVGDFVLARLSAIVGELEAPLAGVTSLAAGADQLIAAELLRRGALLHVVLPSRGYERTFASDAELASFRSLLAAAHAVTRLDFAEPSEQAFLAAGRSVVDACGLLLAVWDGEPARGLGGTADVVAYARRVGRPVRVVWPSGVGRAAQSGRPPRDVAMPGADDHRPVAGAIEDRDAAAAHDRNRA